MPLVIMCGVPGSGKTTRARQLAEYLRDKHHKEVVVINEESLKMDKNVAFASNC